MSNALEKNRERARKQRLKNIELSKTIVLLEGTKKICSYCKIEKDIKEFGKHRGMKDGLRIYCKNCVNLISRLHTNNNLEHVRIIKLNSYHRNKTNEDFITHNKEYRKTAKAIFSIYKHAAKVRELVFELTFEDFIAWHGKTNCIYCGLFITTIGIDRIDNNLGYIRSNIVPCCSICNRLKMDLSVEEFKKQVKLIFHNFCKEN